MMGFIFFKVKVDKYYTITSLGNSSGLKQNYTVVRLNKMLFWTKKNTGNSWKNLAVTQSYLEPSNFFEQGSV